MSLSPVIDERYRLNPTDLGSGTVAVTIQNVSLQGVEALNPVLHFREFPSKRLVVDAEQCQTLLRMTGSPLFRDWIGQPIYLKTVTNAGQTRIELHDPQTSLHLWNRIGHSAAPQHRQHWTSLGLIIVIILIFGAAYALDNGDAVWQLLKQFLLH